MGLGSALSTCYLRDCLNCNVFVYSVTLAFIVRGQSGKDTEASETVSVLKEADFEDKLKNYHIDDITLKGIC